MSNDFLFGDKTLTFIFMYKYNNIRLIYVNYKSLDTPLKSALVNQFLMLQLMVHGRLLHNLLFQHIAVLCYQIQ